MTKKLVATRMDTELYKEARRVALDKDMPVERLLTIALKQYLRK
jgi:antitoxin component of RelBE/YafQ-DinJ toxin-antitoxin module